MNAVTRQRLVTCLAVSCVACAEQAQSPTDVPEAKDAGRSARELSASFCQGAPPYGDDPYCLNLDCPENPPGSGAHAARGACCLREPNALRREEAAARGAATVTLGYRTGYSVAANHPLSLGLSPVAAAVTADLNRERASILYRFEEPLDAEGNATKGRGSVEIGAGVTHCDGTFSFYAKGSAPAVASRDDRDRWLAVKSPSRYDPALPGERLHHIAWDDIGNRRVVYTPNYQVDGTLDYELAAQGLDFLKNDLGPDSPDCSGKLVNGSWETSSQTVAYLPLAENDVDMIHTTPAPQTLCQLLSFGILAATADASCDDTARCAPGSAGCKWVKLPDSLCPVTAAEQALFGCHVGAEDNADHVPTSCTPQPPTEALDPDTGATSEGQCCDALGHSKTLPACNAFRVVSDVVLSAVAINDTGAAKLTLCE